MVLYVDILLAINFSMDFLALFICSLLLHLKLSKLRIILSSIIGATYSLIQVLSGIDGFALIILSLIVGITMVLITFPTKKLGRLCFTCLVYLFVNTLLGGLMSLLYSFFNRILASFISNYSYESTYSSARIFIIISLTGVASIVFSKIIYSKKNLEIVEVTLKINESLYKLRGLCDSGNLLTEPFSGKRVVLISEESEAGKEIEQISDLYKKYIPYSDINGRGMLKGVAPKEIIVNGTPLNLIVATVKNKSFNGYDALVPSGLV